jgi:PEP-CTERM motif
MLISTSRIGVYGLAVSALLVSGTAAQAGLLAANSGGAIPAYTGTQFFDANFSGFTVSANVDFAVFAPGAFDAAFPGQDTSGGTDYVYAYQIANLDTDITKLTVGLDGDEPLGVIGSIADGGSTVPTNSAYVGAGPTSSAWDFTGPGALANGSTSDILIFTSAAPPEWDSATVSASWFSTQDLPSPVPEPASLVLMAMGLGLTCVRKHSRR